MDIFLHIDLPLMTVAVLSTVACSLLGGFLVLRRQSLIGDALSHALLPGLALGFMVSGRIEPLTMFLGALGAVGTAIVCISALHQKARIEKGAAMGGVFTLFFAVGVILLEKGVGPGVHLDAHHALFGALETVIWIPPPTFDDWSQVWNAIPRQIKTLLGITIVEIAILGIFYRSLVVSTFDPEFGRCLGLRTQGLDLGFLLLVGVVAVGVFEIVGSILVIAMFICPAAAARMLTDRLSTYLGLTVFFGIVSGVVGYGAAAWGPLWLGFDHSVTVAGMIAVTAGMCQLGAMMVGGFKRTGRSESYE